MKEAEVFVLYEIKSLTNWRRRKFKTKEQAIASFDAKKDLCIYEVTYRFGNYGSLAYFPNEASKVIAERRIYG